MQCTQCPAKPKLTHHLENEFDGYAPEPFKCYGCGTEITAETDEFWECKTCTVYKLCDECRFCSKGHGLVKTIFLSNISTGYGNNGFICNICKSNGRTTDCGIWHCTPCEYDVCIKCLE